MIFFREEKSPFNMSLILCIETSSSNCSVALLSDNNIVSYLELSEGYIHSEKLHPGIKEVMMKSGYKLEDLDGIAIGSGPGSFTGLRIGSAAAKGLSYALSIPLMSLSSLKNMALQVLSLKESFNLPEKVMLCPMIDARRMEVYCAIFDENMNEVLTESAIIINESTFFDYLKHSAIVFFGSGMEKIKGLYSENTKAFFIEGILPSALAMKDEANRKFREQTFENTAYFEPTYIKGFQPTNPKNQF